MVVITAEGATRNSLDGKQVYDNKVEAQINYCIEQNPGYFCYFYLVDPNICGILVVL